MPVWCPLKLNWLFQFDTKLKNVIQNNVYVSNKSNF